MFTTRGRAVVTTAAALEVGIAGWWLGHGVVWLLAMLAAITLTDCALGVVRRRAYADLAGVELGAVLVALLARSADGLLTAAVAGSCAAWLARPERQTPARRRSASSTTL
jgi:hypothetical protein